MLKYCGKVRFAPFEPVGSQPPAFKETPGFQQGKERELHLSDPILEPQHQLSTTLRSQYFTARGVEQGEGGRRTALNFQPRTFGLVKSHSTHGSKFEITVMIVM
jgi:hypothetical protein